MIMPLYKMKGLEPAIYYLGIVFVAWPAPRILVSFMEQRNRQIYHFLSIRILTSRPMPPILNSRSTSGYSFIINGASIHWQSKQQSRG
jgi:hypothetical protein